MTDNSLESTSGAIPEIEGDYVNYDEIIDSLDIDVKILGLSVKTKDAFKRGFIHKGGIVLIRDIRDVYENVNRHKRKVNRVGKGAFGEMQEKLREVFGIELLKYVS